MGAEVKAFDSRKEMREQVEKLGAVFISIESDSKEVAAVLAEQKNKVLFNYLKKKTNSLYLSDKKSMFLVGYCYYYFTLSWKTST